MKTSFPGLNRHETMYECASEIRFRKANIAILVSIQTTLLGQSLKWSSEMELKIKKKTIQ